jgi:hypothetical protein
MGDSVQEVMKQALTDMETMLKQSIVFQTEMSKVTTFLGQVAARAAKQTPQG